MEFTRKALNRFNYLFGETEAVYHELSQKLGLSDSATKEVCLRSGLSKQTANSALHKLEEAGLVCRESAGPRAKRLCLTAAGQALADRTVARIIQMENEVFAGWSPQEVETYLALTERFLQDLKARAAALDMTP